MTNFEYYKDKILEIAKKGDGVAMNKEGGAVRECRGFDCCNCAFNNGSRLGCCRALFNKWLYEEHKEWPTLTRFQHDFLEKMAKKYNWMARDAGRSNALWFYEHKPEKRNDGYWSIPVGKNYNLDTTLDDYDFMKWKDDPYNIRELLDNCEVK